MVLRRSWRPLVLVVSLSRPSVLFFRSFSSPRSALYSQIAPLRDHRLSVRPALDAWAERGRVLADDLRFMIRELRKRNRRKHALEISEWMHIKGMCFMPKDHAVHMDLIGSVKGSAAAETYFNYLGEKDRSEKTYGALLNCYVRERLTEKSLSLLEKMKELGLASNALTYNGIMCLYTNMGQHSKVPPLLSEMKESHVRPDNFSYRICINSYGALSNITGMENVLEEMEHQPHIVMDWNTYAVVANIYIKAHLPDKAEVALKKSEERLDDEGNLCYSHLISLYGHLKNKSKLEQLWNLQKSKHKNQINKDYIIMLGALGKIGDLNQAEALLKEWESSGNPFDFRVPNALLVHYCNKGLVEKADAIIEGYERKGKIPPSNSWGFLAKGFVNNGEYKKAYQCMEKALRVYKPNSGWEPNPKTTARIFKGLSENEQNL